MALRKSSDRSMNKFKTCEKVTLNESGRKRTVLFKLGGSRSE